MKMEISEGRWYYPAQEKVINYMPEGRTVVVDATMEDRTQHRILLNAKLIKEGKAEGGPPCEGCGKQTVRAVPHTCFYCPSISYGTVIGNECNHNPEGYPLSCR